MESEQNHINEYTITISEESISIFYPSHQKKLEISRKNYSFTSSEIDKDISDISNKIEAYGILGIITYNSKKYLLFVDQAELVTTFDHKFIYKIKSVDFLKITSTILSEIEYKEFSILKENVIQLMNQGFYFSNGFDLSTSMNKKDEESDFTFSYNELYTINSYLIKDFKDYTEFISFCIYGNVIISEELNISDTDLTLIDNSENDKVINYSLSLTIILIERYNKYSINFLDLLGLNNDGNVCYFFKEVEVLYIINRIKKFSYIYCQSSYPVHYNYSNSNEAIIKKFFENIINNYNNLSLISFLSENNVNRDKLINAYEQIKKKDKKNIFTDNFCIYEYYEYESVDEFLCQKEVKNKLKLYSICGNFNEEELRRQKGIIWMINYEGNPTMNVINFELASKLSQKCLTTIFKFLGFDLSEIILKFSDKLFEKYKEEDIKVYNYINTKTVKERYMSSIGLEFILNEGFKIKNQVFKKKLNVRIITWNCAGITPEPNQRVPSEESDLDSEELDSITVESNLGEIKDENYKILINEKKYNDNDEESKKKEEQKNKDISDIYNKDLNISENNIEDNLIRISDLNKSIKSNKKVDYDLSPLFIFNNNDKNNSDPDIIVVALQEIVKLTAKNIILTGLNETSVKNWRIMIFKEIENSYPNTWYELVKEQNLVGVLSLIFKKKDLPLVEIENIIIKNGAFGLGNKGDCISIMKCYDSYFGFCVSHFTAGQKKVNERLQILKNILNLRLPILSKKLGYDNFYFKDLDLWFITGDLNFRLDLKYEKVIEYVNKNKIFDMFKNDQLYKEKLKNKKLNIINEGLIRFNPTYKYDIGKDTYSYNQKKLRTPSYCDRILFKKSVDLIENEYNAININYSDHRPVYATFEAYCKEIISNFNEIISKKINIVSKYNC